MNLHSYGSNAVSVGGSVTTLNTMNHGTNLLTL